MAVVRVLYFASVREAIGCDAEDVETDAATLGALADRLAGRGGGYAVLADRTRLRAAIDLRMAGFDAPLRDAREIAFFPPVTGG